MELTDVKKIQNRGRKRSPGCRSINSAQTPHASYRESNASRLRQEMKGMTITGIIKRGPRSQSSSPNHQSTHSSPTHSLNNYYYAPRKRASEKTLEIAFTPRTMSETSNTSRDRCRQSSSGSLGNNVIDTHSKTLNSVHNDPSLKDTAIPKKNCVTPPSGIVRPNIANGYGKPLVTPINKKLSILKDIPVHDSVASLDGKISVVCRGRSPVKSLKAERKGTFSARPKVAEVGNSELITPKVDVITSILIHIILWRFAQVVSLLLEALHTAVAIIALAVLFWIANKEPAANALRASNTSPNVRRERTPVGGSPVVKLQRPNSSTIPKPNRSPTKDVKSLEKPSVIIKQPPVTRTKPRPKSSVVVGEKVSTDSANISPPRVNRIPLRNSSTEKLKQQFCRDMPVYAAGRPNYSSIHSSTRSFKPQLEDIKSSYLLLNKTPKEKSKVPLPKVSKDEKVSKSKPKPIDENQRKELLVEVKKKFQSRTFKAEAKYDKIEGLNWISWK